MKRQLVIFDLDETLVHATRQKLDRAPDFQFDDYGVFVRPHLDSMLEAVAPKFDLAVWSSATKPYVDLVVSCIFSATIPLKFAWSVDRCVQRVDAKSNGYVYIKDLRKVQGQGYAVEQILMVDDSPEKISRQPRSHIQISPFVGSQQDAALLELPSMLARATNTAGVAR